MEELLPKEYNAIKSIGVTQRGRARKQERLISYLEAMLKDGTLAS